MDPYECDGCGATGADVLAVYEDDDPETDYTGSRDPAYLCWECRHPEARNLVAAERNAAIAAMLICGLTLEEKMVASIAIAKHRKENAA
jgi:hypothetical protein